MENLKNIYFAGGCFWGLSAFFDLVTGVIDTECGYANGNTKTPTYNEVCTDTTGFAETVKISYDSSKTNLEKLLTAFFAAINPIQKNGQANDYGTQYRTGIFFTNSDDEKIINAFYSNVQKKYEKPLATEVLPLSNYYAAEEYHQKYLDKNPTGYCHLDINKIFKKLGESNES